MLPFDMSSYGLSTVYTANNVAHLQGMAIVPVGNTVHFLVQWFYLHPKNNTETN